MYTYSFYISFHYIMYALEIQATNVVRDMTLFIVTMLIACKISQYLRLIDCLF